MARYYVTGVFKNEQNVLTHIVRHGLDQNNRLQTGGKISVGDTITSIDAGNEYYTLRWNYSSASWIIGAKIIVVGLGPARYIRTQPDAQVIDNLDNMIRLNSLY